MTRLITLVLALGCSDKGSDVIVEVDCGSSADAALCTEWLMSEGTSPIIDAGVATDITGVVLEDGVWTIRSNGLPSYTVVLDAAEIDALNARGQAATDFTSGVTTAEAGVTYDWGADIGFQSAHYGCADGAGYGWFPPGPACPEGNEKTIRLLADPTPAMAGEECELGLGATGWWLNGVSVYNWSDGQTTMQGQWRNIAQELRSSTWGRAWATPPTGTTTTTRTATASPRPEMTATATAPFTDSPPMATPSTVLTMVARRLHPAAG